jgi:hypothetical protein
MDDLEYPKWQEPYLEAILELNPEKLCQRVHAAEAAMFLRLEALRTSSDGRLELQAIHDALDGLGFVKREDLTFPNRKLLHNDVLVSVPGPIWPRN